MEKRPSKESACRRPRYGPDFHGHERVLREERVFHNFDPAKAHKSQFLHPILRFDSKQTVPVWHFARYFRLVLQTNRAACVAFCAVFSAGFTTVSQDAARLCPC